MFKKIIALIKSFFANIRDKVVAIKLDKKHYTFSEMNTKNKIVYATFVTITVLVAILIAAAVLGTGIYFAVPYILAKNYLMWLCYLVPASAIVGVLLGVTEDLLTVPE